MAKAFSRSVLMSVLVAIALTSVAAQVWAALESKPIVNVAVYSPLGFTTFRADRLSPIPFTASWGFEARAPDSKADLYVGVLSPGAKTAYTWARRDGRPVLLKGMYPFMAGVSADGPVTYTTWGDLRYTPTGMEEKGMYLAFAMVVSAGKDPGDPASWQEVEMKPLFIGCPVLNPQCQ